MVKHDCRYPTFGPDELATTFNNGPRKWSHSNSALCANRAKLIFEPLPMADRADQATTNSQTPLGIGIVYGISWALFLNAYVRFLNLGFSEDR